MKIGDLVRYKKMEFVTDRVHEEIVGLVVETTSISESGLSMPVRVKWNTQRCDLMWHPAFDLELISESQ